MKREVEAAVSWWKAALSSDIVQDNGDVLQTALATWVRDRQPKPTAKQIEDFGSALEEILLAILPKYWPEPHQEVRFGSACEGRCLSVDYGPDRVLAAAAQAANIHYGATLFPVKTVMWISPGIVKVRQGYGGQEEVIWQGGSFDS